jgi:glycerol-3-phosphate acyltransferase PlsY
VVASVACLVASYLLGTFPTALLAGRRVGVDPTQSGSGNPGTTNVLRTAGRYAAVLTLVGDAGKGALAAGLGWIVGGHELGVLCGLAAILGHVAPLTRRFQGGKGVATSFGMLVVVFPGLAALGAVVFGVAFVVTRTVSVASLTAALSVPVAALVVGVPGSELAALAAGALLVLVRHTDNIRRLARGEEGTLRA